MNYEIKPFVGVGPIRFGMAPEEVRRLLRQQERPRPLRLEKSARKSDTTIPADFFTPVSIFVYYKEPAACEAVEFCNPLASPTFEGQHFIGRPYREAERWMKTMDSEVALDPAGLRSPKLGFGLYAESAKKEPDLPVEAVIVFEKGYYDRPLQSATVLSDPNLVTHAKFGVGKVVLREGDVWTVEFVSHGRKKMKQTTLVLG